MVCFGDQPQAGGEGGGRNRDLIAVRAAAHEPVEAVDEPFVVLEQHEAAPASEAGVMGWSAAGARPG